MLRRGCILDDNGAGERGKTRFLLRTKVLSGVDDDRQLEKSHFGFYFLEQLDASRIRQHQIEDQAVEGLGFEYLQGFGSRSCGLGRDIFAAEQIDQVLPLNVVILHNQQLLRLAAEEDLNLQ